MQYEPRSTKHMRLKHPKSLHNWAAGLKVQCNAMMQFSSKADMRETFEWVYTLHTGEQLSSYRFRRDNAKKYLDKAEEYCDRYDISYSSWCHAQLFALLHHIREREGQNNFYLHLLTPSDKAIKRYERYVENKLLYSGEKTKKDMFLEHTAVGKLRHDVMLSELSVAASYVAGGVLGFGNDDWNYCIRLESPSVRWKAHRLQKQSNGRKAKMTRFNDCMAFSSPVVDLLVSSAVASAAVSVVHHYDQHLPSTIRINGTFSWDKVVDAVAKDPKVTQRQSESTPAVSGLKTWGGDE